MIENLEELLDEVRLLWHVLAQSAEQLHAKEPVTLGMRAILEFLAFGGPTTVPRIARSRHVTRQHIQTLVNALLDLDLVVLETNPEHRRSALVRLTPKGQKAIVRMKQREQRFLERLGFGAKTTELVQAAQTLRTIRKTLEAGHELIA